MNEDLEVLDLTTPQPPTPISRFNVVSSGGVCLLSSPKDNAGRNGAHERERREGSRDEMRQQEGRERFNPQEYESNDESDDDFSIGSRIPLRERLKLKTAPTSTASFDCTQAGSSSHSTKIKSPRFRTNSITGKLAAANFTPFSRSTSAISATWEAYLGDPDDELARQSDRVVCEMKYRNSGPSYDGGVGSSGSQEKRATGAVTELVNLLSDSDDDERGGEVNVNAEGLSGTDRNPDRDEAGLEDPLGIDDFDTLILSSQTSSRSSPLRPTQTHQNSEQSDPGGPNWSTDMPNHFQDDDDDFSLDSFVIGATRYMGGGSGGIESSSSSSGGGNGSLSARGGQGEGNVVDDAPRTREEKALARKEAAVTKKRQREEAAAAAKQKREQERLARKIRAEAEKAEKLARSEKAKQANGRYSHLEISCVMERDYFEDSRSAETRAAAARQPNGTEEFVVAHGDFDVPGGIWWTRRAHLDGGAAATGHGVETLDILAVVVYPERLLQYLRYCSDARDGNVFPDLGRFVDSIRASAKAFNRIILILEGVEIELDKQWNQPQWDGNSSSGSPATRTEVFEDAQSWLLIHKDVETRITKDGADTGQYLWDFTRALSTIPYKNEVTELHCIPRFKTKARGSENLPPEDQKMADTWVRMLLQIPDIGESKAVEIAAHYPFPRDLVCALLDPGKPEEERAVLLAGKMGSGRQERKCARRVFDLFTHEDGNFVLN